MTKELKELQDKLENVNHEYLGNTIFEAFNEEDNYLLDMSRDFVSVVQNCNTDAEFVAADHMCIALTGWSIKTIIQRYENALAGNLASD